MKYSTQKPVVPGWYWCKNPDTETPGGWEAIVRVEQAPCGLVALFMGGIGHRPDGTVRMSKEAEWNERTQWAGPLPIPGTGSPEEDIKILAAQLLEDCKIKVLDTCGSPYMIRLSLEGEWKLHVFLRSDHDRELHDHPWSFNSLVLSGEYFEEVPREAAEELQAKSPGVTYCDFKTGIETNPGNVLIHRQVGDFDFRPANWKHRVHILKPCLTLVKVGERVREWGFWRGEEFIPWRKLVKEREC